MLARRLTGGDSGRRDPADDCRRARPGIHGDPDQHHHAGHHRPGDVGTDDFDGAALDPGGDDSDDHAG